MQASWYRRGRWTAKVGTAALAAMVSLAGCQTAGMKPEEARRTLPHTRRLGA